MSVLKDPDVKKIKIAGIIAGIIFLLACANFVAGALLFALHKEDPTKAQFTTIEQAYFQQAEEENPNPKTLQKIKVSIFISLLLCIGGPVALLTMSNKVQGSDMFGSTRFANKEDIQKEKLDTDRGVVIGKFQKNYSG